MHSHDFRDRSMFTPQAEESLARKCAEKCGARLKNFTQFEMFSTLRKSRCATTKECDSKWPEGEHWISEVYKSRMSFEGVRTIYDPTEELIIDDIIVLLGYLSSIGAREDFNQSKVICGHSHRGGVSFRPLKIKSFGELNAGFLGDAESKALSYRPQRLHNWTLE